MSTETSHTKGLHTGNNDADAVIERAIQNNTFPGIACQVMQGTTVIYKRVTGFAENQDRTRPLTDDAIFDLASLTKGLATTVVLLCLMESQGVKEEQSLGTFLPQVCPELADISLKNLMCHTAGLPPVPEMFRLFESADSCDSEKALAHLYNLKPVTAVGRHVVYSCTGYILLGKVAEALGNAPLDELFQSIVCEPGNISDLGYNPTDVQRAVTEEFDPWRNRWLQGQVHDENAWTLGGVSGNAGLFGTLDALVKYSRLFLDGGVLNGKTILSEQSVHTMTHRQTRPNQGEPRAFGFACPYEDIFAGPGFSENSYGHTGFTGTSFWVDPQRELCIISLTNRVHYGRESTAEKIKDFRKDFHRVFL